MVVCPAVLTRHWQREIGKFFPEEMMRPLLYEDLGNTTQGTRASNSSTHNSRNTSAITKDTSNHHHHSMDVGRGCVYGGDVVIVSYEALRRDKGGFFTRGTATATDHSRHSHTTTDDDGANASASSTWLAVVIDEVNNTLSNTNIHIHHH